MTKSAQRPRDTEVPVDEVDGHLLADDVNWLLNRVWLGFGQRRAAALEELGITVREHVVLSVLNRTDATQLQLGTIAGIDKSVVTLTIDALEKKKLLVRESDARDRRAKRPRLTEAGRDSCAAADLAAAAAQKDLLELIPESERAGFIETLRDYTFGPFAHATFHPQR